MDYKAWVSIISEESLPKDRSFSLKSDTFRVDNLIWKGTYYQGEYDACGCCYYKGSFEEIRKDFTHFSL